MDFGGERHGLARERVALDLRAALLVEDEGLARRPFRSGDVGAETTARSSG
jgi:hypothetical protein